MKSKGRGTPGTFSQDQIPGFHICQNGVYAKETKADTAEHVFSKGQHELKTLNVFFESAFEDLSFHSFLKASDCDFEEKNGCNKHMVYKA